MSQSGSNPVIAVMPAVLPLLHPKADLLTSSAQVSKVPVADIAAPLFDHLVGTGENHWRDFETKFRGGVKINQKRERSGRDRKITGFRTFQNLIYVACGAPEQSR